MRNVLGVQEPTFAMFDGLFFLVPDSFTLWATTFSFLFRF
jgi:hypothetical protein